MKLKIIHQTVSALVFLIVVGISAVAVAESKNLSADEVKKAFIGNTLDTGGVVVFFDANGVIKGKKGKHSDTGRYSIKDDGQYCRQWKKWKGGTESCVMIKREGDKFSTVLSDGTVRSTSKMLKGNPEGL